MCRCPHTPKSEMISCADSWNSHQLCLRLTKNKSDTMYTRHTYASQQSFIARSHYLFGINTTLKELRFMLALDCFYECYLTGNCVPKVKLILKLRTTFQATASRGVLGCMKMRKVTNTTFVLKNIFDYARSLSNLDCHRYLYNFKTSQINQWPLLMRVGLKNFAYK